MIHAFNANVTYVKGIILIKLIQGPKNIISMELGIS